MKLTAARVRCRLPCGAGSYVRVARHRRLAGQLASRAPLASSACRRSLSPRSLGGRQRDLLQLITRATNKHNVALPVHTSERRVTIEPELKGSTNTGGRHGRPLRHPAVLEFEL